MHLPGRPETVGRIKHHVDTGNKVAQVSVGHFFDQSFNHSIDCRIEVSSLPAFAHHILAQRLSESANGLPQSHHFLSDQQPLQTGRLIPLARALIDQFILILAAETVHKAPASEQHVSEHGRHING